MVLRHPNLGPLLCMHGTLLWGLKHVTQLGDISDQDLFKIPLKSFYFHALSNIAVVWYRIFN